MKPDATEITQAEFDRLPLLFGTTVFLRWTGWSRQYLDALIDRGDLKPHMRVGRCYRWSKHQLAAATGMDMSGQHHSRVVS